jgi:hypothetical protein
MDAGEEKCEHVPHGIDAYEAGEGPKLPKRCVSVLACVLSRS